MSTDDLFSKPLKYCVDASSLILLRTDYPVEIFPNLHKYLQGVFASGSVSVLNIIFEELEKHEPDILKFIKSVIPKIRQLKYEQYIVETQQILHKYYDGKGGSHNLIADPHMISCAKQEKIIVVTNETLGGETKMPYICQQEGIKSINFIQFLKETDYKDNCAS